MGIVIVCLSSDERKKGSLLSRLADLVETIKSISQGESQAGSHLRGPTNIE
jgi:hypothetical protein